MWQKGAISYLHNNTPVLRSDYDIMYDDPLKSANLILTRVKDRPIPFHWFRSILKSPSWYFEVSNNLKKIDPQIEVLGAPVFFELLRVYLKNNPDAASGKYEYFESLW